MCGEGDGVDVRVGGGELGNDEGNVSGVCVDEAEAGTPHLLLGLS